ncbi:hypothetical protein L9F63_003917 [Diploptera punctata]|uniref:Uncharacterized protein n=1 Tax=Diploptera punctata TaxID=6984 RepID=A0AAD8E8Z2_DIPPU|nr:hypothetical protein L9F63_003917 [Diploptera punctata]
MVRKMLARGADVNCYNEDMLSPLHIAVERYDTRMVKLFLQQPSINVNIRDSQQNTPLHTALDFRHLLLIPILLKKGADVNAKNTLDRTPLHLAAHYCLSNETQLFLDNNAEIDAEDAFGKTPLGLSLLKYQCPTMANQLLKNGACINKITSTKIPMISEAILYTEKASDVSKIRMMIRNGADLTMHSPIGQQTPLHYLTLKPNMQVARILLQNGANPSALNSSGDMPYKNANLFCNYELGELLEFHAKQLLAMEQENGRLGFLLRDDELH